MSETGADFFVSTGSAVPAKRIAEDSALYAAALHWAIGALRKPDVPVGKHDLSRVRIELIAPEGAAVERGGGTDGDGYDPASPAEVVSISAALLFLQKLMPDEPRHYALWLECIKEASEPDIKPRELMPPSATRALRELQAQMQTDCQARRKTEATRTGKALAAVRVERLTLREFGGTFRVAKNGGKKGKANVNASRRKRSAEATSV